MAYIMVVEDDELLAGSMKKALAVHDHEIAVFADTDMAFKSLQTRRPDIIILDVMFPGNKSGGFDFARKIRKHSGEKQRIPVLMLSAINKEFHMGFSGKDIDNDWMPVTAFMDKPVDMGVLVEKTGEMLGLAAATNQ